MRDVLLNLKYFLKQIQSSFYFIYSSDNHLSLRSLLINTTRNYWSHTTNKSFCIRPSIPYVLFTHFCHLLSFHLNGRDEGIRKPPIYYLLMAIDVDIKFYILYMHESICFNIFTWFIHDGYFRSGSINDYESSRHTQTKFFDRFVYQIKFSRLLLLSLSKRI